KVGPPTTSFHGPLSARNGRCDFSTRAPWGMKPLSAIFLRRPNYLVGINAYCPTDHNKLRHVESAFPKLKLRHERLPLTEALPQFNLGNTGVLSSLRKQFDYTAVKIRTK